MEYTAAVITVSDKICRGEGVDTGGPAVCAMLEEHGWKLIYKSLVPNEMETIKTELMKCADEIKASLVLTVGGTGFSPRDVTPEAMRYASLQITPRGCLSRSVAGILGRTLIVNLPGSEKAAKENLAAVIDPIRHGVDMLAASGDSQ